MAWRSSGTTNDEMVDNLKRFQVISSVEVEAAFRSVDRRLFVPENCQDIAHKDQPIRDNNIHISAPHIYGSVLEALELKKDAGLSFLNAGSGTGYLTCIAASILGPRSVHYCVEIHEDVISHSREAIAAWKKCPASQGISNIDFIHGNALALNTNKGECALGFDRIYIGAAIEKLNLPMFKKMLKPGGVLVGPVGDELVKVVRSQSENPEGSQRFTTKVISGVRFAPLIANPSIQTIIPARVWNPSNHSLYPDSFRGACNELLLCSNAGRNQPVKVCPPKTINVASMLPRALWVEVLSFTHRDWFAVPMNEVDYLRRRLAEEQANVERANQAKQEAESKYRLAERERDIYKILARTLRSRLNTNILEESNDSETIEETAAAMLFGGRESLSTFDLGRMVRRFRTPVASAVAEYRNDEEMGDDADEDFEFSEDDDDDMSEEMDDIDDEDEEDSDDDESLSVASDHQNSIIEGNSTLPENIRPQVRTVSISEEDL